MEGEGEADAPAVAAAAASQESIGSLADFIAEPSSQEMAQAGLAFQSDDDDDALAVLRNARPFHSYRRMGAAAAAAASMPLQRTRQRERRPDDLHADNAAAESGDVEGMELLRTVYGGQVDPSFIAAASGCGAWLTDVSLLHDSEQSRLLHEKVLQGYTYEKVVKRQGKTLDVEQAGAMELTACVDYCTHILSQLLGVLWSGGASTPGVQIAGSLMRPDPTSHGMACIELTMSGKPLELSTALLQLVLGHPANKRWRDMVVGRRFYQSNQLVFLVQTRVSLRLA